MTLESATFWIAVFAYAASTLLITVGVIFGSRRSVALGTWAAVTGFAAQTVSLAVRWYVSGRLPYVQEYENALAGTWVIVGVFLLLVWRRSGLKVAGIGVMPFVLLTLGFGLTAPMTIGPVTPAYKSGWLVIHVVFAWATYAAYTACASLAIVELLKTRKKPPKPGSLLDRVPDVPFIQDLTLRLVGFGFLANGVMIASGAIWGYQLWGSYWRWDPVETWTLFTWLAYALYLHLRLTRGWRGRKLAWVAVLALFGVMMSFWGVQLLPNSYHLFQQIGEIVPVERF